MLREDEEMARKIAQERVKEKLTVCSMHHQSGHAWALALSLPLGGEHAEMFPLRVNVLNRVVVKSL